MARARASLDVVETGSLQGRTQRLATTPAGTATASHPTTLGKYRILEPIGEGGFGIVYKGFDPFIKRHVAIKTCTSPDRELRLRYFREAEIAGRLDHPNIVRIFDFGTEDDTPYLVQEFLSGADLDEKATGHDFMPYPERLLYLIQIARGLAYAHDQGVIHRDIKPANIRILADGSVKILDFGVAMLLNTETRLTREGMAVGTAAYLAPEQVQGNPTDRRTDVFSFGILAYELLTGHRPFERETISATLYSIVHDDPRAIALPDHACPEALRSLIARCLEKDPDRRFNTFHQIVESLDGIRAASRPDANRDYSQELREVTAHSTADEDAGSPPSIGAIDLRHAPISGAASARRRPRAALVVTVVGLVILALALGVVFREELFQDPSPDASDAPGQIAVPTAESAISQPAIESSFAGESEAGVPEPEGDAPTVDTAAADTADSPTEEVAEPIPTTQTLPDPEPVEPSEPEVVLPAKLVIDPGWHNAMTASIDGGTQIRLSERRSRELQPGRYSIRFSLTTPDYSDSRLVRVDLESGETHTLANPLRRPGLLSVQASLGSPQGVVHLNGRSVGLSPVRSLRLPPGAHHLQVFAVDHPSIALADQQLEVASGRETVVTFDLTGEKELSLRVRPAKPVTGVR